MTSDKRKIAKNHEKLYLLKNRLFMEWVKNCIKIVMMSLKTKLYLVYSMYIIYNTMKCESDAYFKLYCNGHISLFAQLPAYSK